VGQKVNPIGLRVGIVKTWGSRWYADKNYAQWLHMDIKVRKYIKKKHFAAGISKIEIERMPRQVKVSINAARPGVVIGKGGIGVEELKSELSKMLPDTDVFINIIEVRKPEADAQLIAENVASQLERRVAFRRAMKRTINQAMRFGIKGVKVQVSGRLGGAEMSRREWYLEGRLPLHTLRADIDYGFATASTTYGVIGVKCWVYKGEIFPERAKMKKLLHTGA
jgi:small subunit ribosomal protein S3